MAIATSERHRWWILLGSSLALLMFTIDVSIVNVALPLLAKDFQVHIGLVQWVILSYILVVTSLELGAARLGDLWGRKRLFLIGIAIFTLASMLCGLAGSIEALIFFRALEGVGGVLIAALGLAIATSGFPEDQRGKGLGIVSAVPPTGIALGPTLGGFLTAAFGWRSIFWVNLPIGVLALVVLMLKTPSDRPRNAGETFDLLGCITFALCLGTLILGITAAQHRGGLHPLPLSLLALSLVSLVMFIRWELQCPSPMLDLQIFRSWPLSQSILGNLLMAMIAGGGLFILPFFYTLVVGLSPAQVGLLLAVPAVCNALVAPISGWAMAKVGDRPVALFAMALFSVALWSISQFEAQTTIPLFVAALIPYGMALGLFYPTMNSVIMSHIPPTQVGIGSGLAALTLTLGQLLGTPLMAILVLMHTRHPALSPTQLAASELNTGFAHAYHVCIGVTLLGMVMMAYRQQSA